MRFGAFMLFIWLMVGLVAAGQRGYLHADMSASCAKTGTIALTAVAGPLNYVGVRPAIGSCEIRDAD